eukprot:ctg_378.g141
MPAAGILILVPGAAAGHAAVRAAVARHRLLCAPGVGERRLGRAIPLGAGFGTCGSAAAVSGILSAGVVAARAGGGVSTRAGVSG